MGYDFLWISLRSFEAVNSRSNPPEAFALGEHQKMCQLLGLSDEQLEAHVPHYKCQVRPGCGRRWVPADTSEKSEKWVEHGGTIEELKQFVFSL